MLQTFNGRVVNFFAKTYQKTMKTYHFRYVVNFQGVCCKLSRVRVVNICDRVVNFQGVCCKLSRVRVVNICDRVVNF